MAGSPWSPGWPRPVTLQRFSADGSGQSWSEPVTLFEGKSTHYADCVEVEPNRILVVYDNTPYGWYEIPPPTGTLATRSMEPS